MHKILHMQYCPLFLIVVILLQAIIPVQGCLLQKTLLLENWRAVKVNQYRGLYY